MDIEFQLYNIKRIMKVDGGDGYVILHMHFKPLNYTVVSVLVKND